jgi:hypothetical protein
MFARIVAWVKQTIVEAVVQDLAADLEAGTGRPVQPLVLDVESTAALPPPETETRKRRKK